MVSQGVWQTRIVGFQRSVDRSKDENPTREPVLNNFSLQVAKTKNIEVEFEAK